MTVRRTWVLLGTLTALLILGLVVFAGGGHADTADVLEELGSYVGPYAR